MRILRKNVPGGVVIAFVCIAGAAAYSLGYMIAMRKFNDVVAYNQERANMYSKLSEIDKMIRQEYIGNVDEKELMSDICEGYVRGLESSSCKYLSPDEYKECMSDKSSDENAVKYEMLHDNVGYIKVNSLANNTGDMFVDALKALFGEGVQKVVLDIRGLDGTNLEYIEKCFDSLSRNGDSIKSIDKKGNKEVVYKTGSDRMDIKFAVIVDSDTEGVPELIASACKDSGFGRVIGEKTKGNAVYEKTSELSDGSGLIFPIAHLVTQKEEILTNKGVLPDDEVILDGDKKELFKRGELSHDEDIQLQKAIESLI